MGIIGRFDAVEGQARRVSVVVLRGDGGSELVCGLSGFVDRRGGKSHDALEAIARRMSQTLSHRGPDAEGVFVAAEFGVAFGHRRLAIVDVSNEGAQPMGSPSGRYVLVYNGELYNAAALRSDLESRGNAFRGHSDTEVWVHAFDAWGIRGAIERANGMFAMAVWDREARRLCLARDRLGKKPLYYAWLDGALVFASELKALRAHPSFRAPVDPDALAFFLAHSYIPAPLTIYRGVHKLAAGTLLDASLDVALPETQDPEVYWRLADAFEAGEREPFRGSEVEGMDALEAALDQAVAARRVADVPLGALLSSGLDSTAVVASMAAAGTAPVRTFTIGFDDPRYDESVGAAEVAQHLGTVHETLRASPRDALDLIPMLPGLYDEPFADTSQLPTVLVSRLARTRVTVALAGDGGDEWLAGYDRYFRTLARWRYARCVPLPLRQLAASALERCAPLRFDKVADALRATDVRDLFVRANRRAPWAQQLVAQRDAACPSLLRFAGDTTLRDPLAWMMWLDGAVRLPESILVKVDRASMGVGLEVRAPFLDPEILRLCASFPRDWKVRGDQRKWLLRRVVERRVPQRLLDRPKRGFSVPLGEWLRGELREWAESLLAPKDLTGAGLQAAPVRALWQEHQTGVRDRRFVLWNVLVYRMWQEAMASAGADS